MHYYGTVSTVDDPVVDYSCTYWYCSVQNNRECRSAVANGMEAYIYREYFRIGLLAGTMGRWASVIVFPDSSPRNLGAILGSKGTPVRRALEEQSAAIVSAHRGAHFLMRLIRAKTLFWLMKTMAYYHPTTSGRVLLKELLPPELHFQTFMPWLMEMLQIAQ